MHVRIPCHRISKDGFGCWGQNLIWSKRKGNVLDSWHEKARSFWQKMICTTQHTYLAPTTYLWHPDIVDHVTWSTIHVKVTFLLLRKLVLKRFQVGTKSLFAFKERVRSDLKLLKASEDSSQNVLGLFRSLTHSFPTAKHFFPGFFTFFYAIF